jgi:hypothetical protein
MGEWIGPAPSSPDFVLGAQPLAQPHGCISVDPTIRLKVCNALRRFICPFERAASMISEAIDNSTENSGIVTSGK